jgi:hypothetical protein
MLKYPAFYDQFSCPKCGEPFEPIIINLSAQVAALNKETRGPMRTDEYRDLSIVTCCKCDTVIGVLPVDQENRK